MSARLPGPFPGQTFIDGECNFWKVAAIRNADAPDSAVVHLLYGRSMSELRNVRVLGAHAFTALVREQDFVPAA